MMLNQIMDRTRQFMYLLNEVDEEMGVLKYSFCFCQDDIQTEGSIDMNDNYI